ncbi:MAG: ABC transporter substrate-binding protein [Casimicrobiaceae bacterium]
MDRRTFVGTAAAGILLVGSRAHSAAPLPRVALVFLTIPVSKMADHRFDQAFVRGLRERGLEEGRNVVIERRSAEGRFDRLPELMQELVAASVDVIVTIGLGVGAAWRATRRIPIVAVATDVVVGGAIVSLSRPGGNVTGLTAEADALATSTKRLQLLREIAPNVSRVAVLGFYLVAEEASRRSRFESAARVLGQTIVWAHARTPQDLRTALANMEKERVNALYVEWAPANYTWVREIVDLAAKLKLPSIYEFREGPENGGLMSYGADMAELFRRAATFVDKILKGAKPGDLPMEQPASFELVVNRGAAKTLGINIPQTLRERADAVIG